MNRPVASPPPAPAPPTRQARRLDTPLPIPHLTTRELGRLGEQYVVERLIEAGWVVLDRNVRFRSGEIDIIALDGWTLVILEVKTRRSIGTGLPQTAVTPQKLRRLRALAGEYLMERAPSHRDLRIDVVGIQVDPDGSLTVEHLPGVH